MRDVVVQFSKPSVTVSIGSIGLSSCLINGHLKKIFAVVVNDVRVEVSKSAVTSLPPDNVNSGTKSGDRKTSRPLSPRRVHQLLSVLNYVSVHGFNVSFTATSFALPNCLLHCSVQEGPEASLGCHGNLRVFH